MRGGTFRQVIEAEQVKISIHPPREGWDAFIGKDKNGEVNFNPPTP